MVPGAMEEEEGTAIQTKITELQNKVDTINADLSDADVECRIIKALIND